MRHYFLCITIVALALPFCGDAGDGVRMYVSAPSGLLIRSEATTNAEKLGVVPFAATVNVLETAPDSQTIDGRTGHWQRIEYEGTVGWAFGGFLSSTPVEASAGPSEERIRSFLHSAPGTYGWETNAHDISYDFFPDGRLHIQGPDGEATMWQGRWLLEGDQLTLISKERGQNETLTVRIQGDQLLLDGVAYTRYRPL